MKQSTRIAIATNTLQLLEQGFYINNLGVKNDLQQIQQTAIDNTRLFTSGELELLLKQNAEQTYSTLFEVTNETTLDAVRRLAATETNVACLNFASAKNPGGGFLGGALAQEECIARASGLYPCLLKAKEYYSYHRALNTCLYSDHMIYSPGVPILKEEEGNLLNETVCVAIITSPAVNAGVIKRNEPDKMHQIIPAMQKRIEKLLALYLHYEHNTLVLGAWGCGVFQNDPEEIAQLFYESLSGKYAHCFKKIAFAVKTNNENIIEPFRKRFSK